MTYKYLVWIYVCTCKMMNCITKPPFVTGKMAATYIARQYGNKSFTWALAGSRGRALRRACMYVY
jgi:hypothetical protein